MGSKRAGSDEQNQSDTESGCKHFSSGYLGNPWKCQKDPDANSLLKGMTRSIFHKDFSQSSCIHGSVLQVNAGSPPPPAQPAAHQDHGQDHGWVVGTRTPQIFQQVCGLLQGTAHSPGSVPPPVPLWYSLVVVWGFPRYVAVPASENGEFSRAASGVVQSRWELKEQRATLKHFLGPQSPSSSLQFCLRTDSEKSATPKITDERGIQEFSLHYWKALRPF